MAATRDPRRGMALPIVLLLAASLGGLAASAARSGLGAARAASAFAEAARADELGRGAAEVLAYRLTTGDSEARRGGRIAVSLGGAEIIIDYRSESARVDANRAPLTLLAALLVAAGAEPAVARAAAARAGALRAEAARAVEDGPAASEVPATPGADGSSDGPPAGVAPSPSDHAEPPAAIRDVAEIASAWGLPTEVARRVAPALTVSSGVSGVDPVLADRLVLSALLGSDERVDDYVERRTRGFEGESSALALLPVPARDFASFEDSPAVRALARVSTAGGLVRRYEMVLAPARTPAGTAVSVASLTRAASSPVVVSWRRLP